MFKNQLIIELGNLGVYRNSDGPELSKRETDLLRLGEIVKRTC